MATKKSARTGGQYGQDVFKRKATVLELAHKHPQAALKALDLLADNKMTDMARDVIAGEDVALKYHMPESRIQKMAARALRYAGLVSMVREGTLAEGMFELAPDLELRASK